MGLVANRIKGWTSVSQQAIEQLLDAEREAALPGAPLLGTGFALRLARNLSAELGGSLTIAATRLTSSGTVPGNALS